MKQRMKQKRFENKELDIDKIIKEYERIKIRVEA